MACTMDGVRIPSATLCSSVTVLPPSKTATSGSSFQTVLANTSTEGGSEAHSMSHLAPSPNGGKAEDRAADNADVASTSSAASESSTVDGGRGGQLSGTIVATETSSSSIAVATPVATLASTKVFTAVDCSSDGYFRQNAVRAWARDAGSQSPGAEGTGEPAGNNTALRGSGKQDRPKTQADSKDGGKQTAAVATLADPSGVPVVTIVGGQGAARGHGDEASGGPAKHAASDNSTGTPAKTTEPFDGTRAGDTRTETPASGATGLEQGVLMQAPAAAFEAGLNLSATLGPSGNSEFTSHSDVGLPAPSPAQKDAPTVDGSGKTTDETGNAKSIAAGWADTSSHAAGDSQTAQSSSGDTSKMGTGTVVAKATENAAGPAPMQTLLTPVVAHEAATAQHAAPGMPEAAHAGRTQDVPASAQMDGGDAVASGINSAKLIQTMGETEMHVGMHSAEFGDISIRTSLSQQQMVTQISLDHNDLSQAISAHLSTVQAKLGEEYGLRASIEINNQGTPFSGGDGNSSQRDQQTFRRSSQEKSIAPASSIENVSGVVAQTSASSGHGLDITV